MNDYQGIFRRFEKKFLMDDEQFGAFREMVMGRLEYNQYHKSTICNLYFDTPDYRLIRASIETPVPIYKEKLRLRTYGVPGPDGTAFVELKKKYDGVVFKRRIAMPLSQAYDYLENHNHTGISGQISHEIDYFMKYYGYPEPAMFVSYDREAYFDRENNDVRITFDDNIVYRTEDLALENGVGGSRLLAPGQHLMEVKIPEAMPLWLVRALSELEIRRVRYSKYGNAYKRAFCVPGSGKPVTVFDGERFREVTICA